MAVIKKLIKSGLRFLAPMLGRHRITLNRHNLLVLTYHRVLDPEDPRILYEQPGMYVTPTTFARQVQTLKKHFTFVRLSEWLQQAKQKTGNLPKYACAITFDDGWQDNYEYAFPVLKQENIPATIFLVSSLIGGHYDFWPGKLARLLHHTAHHNSSDWEHPVFDWLKTPDPGYAFNHIPPDCETLDRIINHCKHYSDTENHQFIDLAAQYVGYKNDPDSRTLLNDKEIKTMLNSGLVDIGSHTAHHIRMSDSLSAECLQEELIGSKQALEQRFAVPVSLFCYPNGDISNNASQVVAQHYTGACTTRSGWNTPSTPAHALNRISIHEDISSTEQDLLLKISGWI